MLHDDEESHIVSNHLSSRPTTSTIEVVTPRRNSLSLSAKAARLVRVFDHAVAVFTHLNRARAWLNQPKKRFDNRTPLAMLRTEIGGRMVEEMLGQIDHGMFA